MRDCAPCGKFIFLFSQWPEDFECTCLSSPMNQASYLCLECQKRRPQITLIEVTPRVLEGSGSQARTGCTTGCGPTEADHKAEMLVNSFFPFFFSPRLPYLHTRICNPHSQLATRTRADAVAIAGADAESEAESDAVADAEAEAE